MDALFPYRNKEMHYSQDMFLQQSPKLNLGIAGAFDSSLAVIFSNLLQKMYDTHYINILRLSGRQPDQGGLILGTRNVAALSPNHHINSQQLELPSEIYCKMVGQTVLGKNELITSLILKACLHDHR